MIQPSSSDIGDVALRNERIPVVREHGSGGRLGLFRAERPFVDYAGVTGVVK